ncbi:hypothetical protein DPMN_136096 [Dreissena polymorpha]|uniref:Uncharacterized protein n=1 Tax=Dreissena polymorpha TaxID=45954 RepID=A0A9D4G302_DREPO|nr:hypothetical protein DPMN_136096 [Dreissena polymorpha]
MHHSLHIRCCLPEAEVDFSQNIDPLVIIQKSCQVLEYYLSASIPCQPVFQDSFLSYWQCSALCPVFCGIGTFVRNVGLKDIDNHPLKSTFAVNGDSIVINTNGGMRTYISNKSISLPRI